MAVEIGYAGKVTVAADTAGTAGSFSAVGGAAKGNITPKRKTADVTTLNSAGYDMAAPTLLGADISLECFYIPADAGQAILLSSLQNGTRMWINVYRDATHFSQAACYCTEFPTDIDPANPVKVSVKLVFDGTATVSPATPLTIA